MLIVRGRRQVGKSRLFTEFVGRSGCDHVFFTAVKSATLPAQLDAFRREVHESVPSLPEAGALAEIATTEAWWDRSNAQEVDVVGTNPIGRVVAIGSIEWRERRQFSVEELDELAANRAVVPGAGGAKLLAVCPAGARSRPNPDLVFDAESLLASRIG